MKLRIMTYNIQHGLNYVRRVIDLDATAGAIRSQNVSLCGLNEVRGSGERDDYTAQAETLASKLDMYSVFGMSALIRGFNPYGNALVSAYPVMQSEVIPIPETTVGAEPRSILRCVLSNGLTVLQSHFGLTPPEKEKAVELTRELLTKTEGPCILMGDFNLTPDDDIIAPLYNDPDISSVDTDLTFPSIDPVKKIDYIFANKKVKILSVCVPEITESDHRPIVAEIEI